MKKSIPIKPFWYSDILVLPKIVTIITTLNKQGTINAAPYSLFSPYDVMTNQPQIMVGMRKFSHTYKNIIATGEFVVNFPSADYLDDIMETSRFYPEGVNELENTKCTPIPSQQVKVPSIKECNQHIECRLHEHFEIDKTQAKVIGNIAAIVVDDDLLTVGRGERIKKLNMPIYMGDEKRKYFYYGRVNTTEMIELKAPPKKEGKEEEEVVTKLPWESGALLLLNEIPSIVRTMVAEMAEDIAQKEGLTKVTHERFIKLMEEYAPKDVMDRIEKE